jgi:uncharacterized protein YjiS (DUF1127 family)
MAATAFFRVPSHRSASHERVPSPVANVHRHGQPTLRIKLAVLHEVWRRWRSRQYLTALDDRMLRDIGVTRAEAEYELNKPFWRT